jgi:hypothetical protein
MTRDRLKGTARRTDPHRRRKLTPTLDAAQDPISKTRLAPLAASVSKVSGPSLDAATPRRKLYVDALPTTAALPQRLAPAPDFRYVGLDAGGQGSFGAWAGLLGAGAAVSGMALHSTAGAALGVGVAAVGVLSGLPGSTPGGLSLAHDRVALAIVPWGVLIETPERSRILHWPAIVSVEVETIHGRDQGTPTTRYSLVTIVTAHERFVGRGTGALPLERLSAHLPAYAEESSHRIALDLDGLTSGEGPSEPDAEILLAAARAYIETGTAAGRLSLPGGSYRQPGTGGAGFHSVGTLSAVLRDRTARAIDPRPFAAIVAVELRATDVADDLVDLVQSPLPMLAAVAKVAAAKLGVARAKVGSLEEVEPFLLKRDAEALAAWQAA